MRNDTTPPDEAIPYALAAKALRRSRRTVERMVAAGKLEAADGAQIASVTRRSLVALLEAEGNADATLDATRADAAHTAEGLSGPALLALLDQIREANQTAQDARVEAVELKAQLRQIEAAKEADAAALEAQQALLQQLIHGSRRERRQARKQARSRPS